MIITIDLSDEMTVLDKVTKQPCKYVRLLMKRTPASELQTNPASSKSNRGPYTTTKSKKNTQWTNYEETTLINMYEKGDSYSKIAKVLHRTPFSIGARVSVLIKKGTLKVRRRKEKPQ